MMDKIIYVAYHSADHQMDYWQSALSSRLPSIKLIDALSPESVAAEVLITWDPPEGMLAHLPNLKGVISLAQGVDHILNGKTYPRDLPLARLIDPYMSEAMAEWVLLSVLSYHRDLRAYAEAEARHDWIRLEPRMAARTTVAVLGLGAIGSYVAQSLLPLKFNVIGWSRTEKSLAGVACYSGSDGFSHCIAAADIIVSILPLTASTEGIFGSESFAKMKSGAAFINVGRGRLVDESALLSAIDSGHLSGATLDVMVEEPLPAGHVFWDHPKISVWPHVSAQTNPETAGDQVAAAIDAFCSGRAPQNQVDLSRGY